VSDLLLLKSFFGSICRTMISIPLLLVWGD
jgi:hypothetical protein